MKTLAILGSGHLGQQIAHYALSDNHFDNVVFFDDFSSEKNVYNIPVLGNSNQIISEFEKGSFDEIILGIGYHHLNTKKEIYDRFKDYVPFATLIHSSSWVDKTAIVEKGCVIYPNCAIDAHVVIKANTILNISCTIAHDTVINEHCFLSPRVAVAGFVTINQKCIIGINATLIDSIELAENTKIGGATVVIKSIEKSGLYVGNPAKFIR